MSQTLNTVIELIREGKLRISDHGYDELAEDGIYARDIVESVYFAEQLENYPDIPNGPCVLVLQHDRASKPVHVVWGLPKGKTSPAVLITAYRPDSDRWTSDCRRRRQ